MESADTAGERLLDRPRPSEAESLSAPSCESSDTSESLSSELDGEFRACTALLVRFDRCVEGGEDCAESLLCPPSVELPASDAVPDVV